jgi:predicted N-acetyltransferase YhbS
MEIVNLKERRDLIPLVARWIHEEWGYIRSRSHQEIVQRLEDTCIGEYPFTLIAMLNNEPVGTAALKIHDMDILPEYTPWLAGLYVPAIHRGKKVASCLVSEVELRAAELGFERTFLFTTTAGKLYEKLGWIPMQELEYDGMKVIVMQKVLKGKTAR